MLRLMELENSESYRYCLLSLLESVKAVVNALAEGRITPFEHAGVGGNNEFRYAPSFTPTRGALDVELKDKAYTAMDIARYLGRTYNYDSKEASGDFAKADKNVRAAIDALYLLEVKAITTTSIKDLNWSQLGRFVADAKAHRERTVLRVVKTKDEIAKINAEALRIQAEQRTKEKAIADERAALVKKLAEAKRKEDAEKAQEIKERIVAKEEQAEKIAETFEVKKAALDVKVAEVKQKEMEAKKEDEYAPLRREVSRILSKLEGTTATTRTALEEEVKALARKTLNSNDREMLRQSAIKAGTWYTEFAAMQFLPPLTKRRAK